MVWPLWLYKLNDPLDRWGGEDKVGHFFGAYSVRCRTGSIGWTIAAILAIELIEVIRWFFWKRKGFPTPWPWLTDKVSIKDIVVGLLGMLGATL